MCIYVYVYIRVYIYIYIAAYFTYFMKISSCPTRFYFAFVLPHPEHAALYRPHGNVQL